MNISVEKGWNNSDTWFFFGYNYNLCPYMGDKDFTNKTSKGDLNCGSSAKFLRFYYTKDEPADGTAIKAIDLVFDNLEGVLNAVKADPSKSVLWECSSYSEFFYRSDNIIGCNGCMYADANAIIKGAGSICFKLIRRVAPMCATGGVESNVLFSIDNRTGNKRRVVATTGQGAY